MSWFIVFTDFCKHYGQLWNTNVKVTEAWSWKEIYTINSVNKYKLALADLYITQSGFGEILEFDVLLSLSLGTFSSSSFILIPSPSPLTVRIQWRSVTSGLNVRIEPGSNSLPQSLRPFLSLYIYSINPSHLNWNNLHSTYIQCYNSIIFLSFLLFRKRICSIQKNM